MVRLERATIAQLDGAWGYLRRTKKAAKSLRLSHSITKFPTKKGPTSERKVLNECCERDTHADKKSAKRVSELQEESGRAIPLAREKQGQAR